MPEELWHHSIQDADVYSAMASDSRALGGSFTTVTPYRRGQGSSSRYRIRLVASTTRMLSCDTPSDRPGDAF